MSRLLKFITPRSMQSRRTFFINAIKLNAEQQQPPSPQKLGSHLHKVNNLEKKFLVWTKKYKTVEEVPEMVPAEVLDKARNRMRIRVANIMMALTLVACILVSMNAKRARDSGDSLTKRSFEWHEKMNREAEEKEKAKAS